MKFPAGGILLILQQTCSHIELLPNLLVFSDIELVPELFSRELIVRV